MQLQKLIKKEVEVVDKGQITLPKQLREKLHIKKTDILILEELPGNKIVLTKKEDIDPLDKLLEFIKTMPKIDLSGAWEEVKTERKKDWREDED